MATGADHGRFPFGRPNTERAPRLAASGLAEVLILGVYPSAFHVRWWRPGDRVGRPTVASLAVDVEPVVFWDGAEPSPDALLERWIGDVGFDDRWGRVAVEHNGPSGTGLRDEYLQPLGVELDDVAYTDLVPWFFVKSGKGSQGDAIAARYDGWAAGAGAPQSSLPARPSPAALVTLATSDARRQSLRREIVDIASSTIITLGQEAIDGLRAVADRSIGGQAVLRPTADYGSPCELQIDNHSFTVLPLIHPGFLRQRGTDDPWRRTHHAWAAGSNSSSIRD